MHELVTDLHLRPPDPWTRAPSPAARRPVRLGFIAIAELVGDWWHIEVPQLPGVSTHCTSVGEAADAARDAIALAIDEHPDDFDVRLIVVEPAADD